MVGKRFFDSIRHDLFGGRLRQSQVNGINLICEAEANGDAKYDARHLAYMLATAYHETARRMVPVRETLASSDDEVIKRLDKAYAEGRLPQVRAPYWRRDRDGKAWFGRGLVQITHKRNYQLMSVVSGYNLLRNPDLALDARISAVILLRGMQLGCFTGLKLSDFFNHDTCDWTGARKVVNGMDRAEEIGRIALCFFHALQRASIEPKAA